MDKIHNHTAVGAYSSKLNPMDPDHTFTIGPAINLDVSPGDTVRIKAFAKYFNSILHTNKVVTALASAIAASFGNISPIGEAVTLHGAFSAALAVGAALPNTDRQGAPKAYLQYIVFNKNMTMAQHGHVMVERTDMGSWQKMELEVPLKKE